MPNIFVEKDLKERFVQYLIQHDYPQNRIVSDWGNGSFFIDIAIMADDLVTPLAFFEVKKAISIAEAEYIAEKIKAYIKKLNISVPVYIVFPDSKLVGQFEVLNLFEMLEPLNESNTKLENEDISNMSSGVLSYQTLENGAKSKIIAAKQVQRKKSIDNLKLVCWLVIPIIGFILILLDAFEKYVFSNERLIVFGAILVVVLLPFFSEITFGDVSVKRKKEDKEK